MDIIRDGHLLSNWISVCNYVFPATTHRMPFCIIFHQTIRFFFSFFFWEEEIGFLFFSNSIFYFGFVLSWFVFKWPPNFLLLLLTFTFSFHFSPAYFHFFLPSFSCLLSFFSFHFSPAYFHFSLSSFSSLLSLFFPTSFSCLLSLFSSSFSCLLWLFFPSFFLSPLGGLSFFHSSFYVWFLLLFRFSIFIFYFLIFFFPVSLRLPSILSVFFFFLFTVYYLFVLFIYSWFLFLFRIFILSFL